MLPPYLWTEYCSYGILSKAICCSVLRLLGWVFRRIHLLTSFTKCPVHTRRGVLPEKLGGVCGTLPETLNLFQTKTSDFSYPISDPPYNQCPRSDQCLRWCISVFFNPQISDEETQDDDAKPEETHQSHKATKPRQEIVSYLFPFPALSNSLAFRLAILIFAKTRFCSHINFIGRCLKSYLRPFPTSRCDGKPQEFRTKIHLPNRHT